MFIRYEGTYFFVYVIERVEYDLKTIMDIDKYMNAFKQKNRWKNKIIFTNNMPEDKNM